MARRTPKPTPKPGQRSAALVAAAAPLDITSKAQVKRIADRQQSWQPEAAAYAKSIGMIADTLGYRANVISKVRLFAALAPADGDEAPIPTTAAALPTVDAQGATVEPLLPAPVAEVAEATMRRLHEGMGVPTMLRKLALNLDVVGECHVIGEDTDDGETWGAYSNGELRQANGKLSILEHANDKRGRPVAEGATAFRVWTPDFEFGSLAFSPLRPIVEEGIAEELLLIGREMRSGSKSRVWKGVWAIAQSVARSRLSTSADGDAADLDEADGGSTFQSELIEMVTTPLANDGSAGEAVPWVIEVPDELLREKWQEHIPLGAAYDSKLEDRAKHLLERIAGALPMPPEISLGMGDINHWGSWQIERAAFRHYMEPTVLALCHAFTVGFLRPMLTAEDVDPDLVRRLVVWYDPSGAIAEPNRLEAATQGVELNAVGRAAWRRIAEFDEEDAPSEDELVRFTGLDRGILTADLTLRLLQLAGLVPEGVTLGDQAAPGAPAPRAVGPGEPDPQEPPPDDTPAPVTAASRPVSAAGERLAAIDRRLFAQVSTAADMALERAVEKAGARLRSLANRNAQAARLVRDVPVTEVARTLGRPMAVSLAQGDEDDEATLLALVGGSFATLAARFEALVERAQSATVGEALAVALPEDRPTDAELAALAAEQADDRERASGALVAALSALAVSVLFDGRPEAGPGEVDATTIVPANVVREALAVAGGAQDIERTAVGGLSVDGRPVGQVATGERSRTLFARIRAWWTGYRWEYGDASTRQTPFPPHQAMAGRTFARWDDPALSAEGIPWLGSLTVSPGDHRGCQCGFVPVVLDPTASERAA